MTRETKVGLAVAGSFLSLVTVVVAAKMSQPEPAAHTQAGDSIADARAKATREDRANPDKKTSAQNEKQKNGTGTNPSPSSQKGTIAPTVIPAGGLVPNPPAAQVNSKQTDSNQTDAKQGVAAPPPIPPGVVTEGPLVSDPTTQIALPSAELKNSATNPANDIGTNIKNDAAIKTSQLLTQIDQDKKSVPDVLAAVSPLAAVAASTLGTDKNPLVVEPAPAPPAVPNPTITAPPPLAAIPASPAPMPPVAPVPQSMNPMIAANSVPGVNPLPGPAPDPVPLPSSPTKINVPEAPAVTPVVPPVVPPPAANPPSVPAPVPAPVPTPSQPAVTTGVPPPVTPPAPISITKNNGPTDTASVPVANPSPIAATSGVSTVPSSPPAPDAPAASTAPIPVKSQNPVAQAKVESYDVMSGQVQSGETLADVSKRIYSSDKYSSALLKFNRDYDPSNADLQSSAVLRPGTKVYLPPAYILEKPEYAGSPVPSGSSPAVQVGTPTPLSSAPGNPAAVNAPPPGVKMAAAGPDGNGNYRVRDGGEHIFDIARTVYGNGDRWADIYRLNPGLNPSFPIPAGTVVKLPPASGR